MAAAADVESMEEAAAAAASLPSNNRKRKINQGKKKKKPNKKLKPLAKPKNPSQKMKKLFKKRAKAYNSDDDEEEEVMDEEEREEDDDEEMSIHSSGDDGDDDEDEDEDEDEEENQRDGITKFSVGCKAFRTAFLNIINKHLPNDPLGPILLAHKKLVAEKLLEEETEHKSKGKTRKEKHLDGEKGHIKPASFLDTKEKLLISIATKGVVKLFNAVNKAQNPQKGLTPSRSKNAKELAKQRKVTFLSELKKSIAEASALNSSKAMKSTNRENDDGPWWTPLRDSYMLTNSKLKDWDKMPLRDPGAIVDQGRVPLEGSSDED